MNTSNTVAQSGTEWLKWRQEGLGSSDAPVVMGASPFRTPRDLFYDKTQELKSEPTNYAQERGLRLEPQVRTLVELRYDMDFPPKLTIHPVHTYLRASLDGYNEQERIVLEIKCPGALDHKQASNGIVPAKYKAQVQHQLLVTGAIKALYASWDEKDLYVVEVFPDKPYQAELMSKMNYFWFENVKKGIPPEPSDRDFVDVVDTQSVELFKQWHAAKTRADLANTEADELRETIINKFAGIHPRISCGGIKLTKVERRGSIDYSKVQKLQGEDLEKYRKPPVVSYVISSSIKP